MGIRAFFHKIKMGFLRSREASIPFVDAVKRYGNTGEDTFVVGLRRELPACRIKKNVMIFTPEGDAEIDCLVLYGDKLFAIEVKRWRGQLTETEGGFKQEKTDRWTGEIHTKQVRSPFKQLGRAIYLLKKQIPIKAWVNPIIFFEDSEAVSVSASPEHVWFDRLPALANYIQREGKASFGTGSRDFFDRCIPADSLYTNFWGNSLHCVIDRTTLNFSTPGGTLTHHRISSIRVLHHWSYDELCILLTDGSECVLVQENARIQVKDSSSVRTYALCKLDYIELGRALEPSE